MSKIKIFHIKKPFIKKYCLLFTRRIKLRHKLESHLKKISIFALLILPATLSSFTSSFVGMKPMKGGIMCRYRFPKAKNVYLAGDFNNWDKNFKLEKVNDYGVFELFLPLLLDKKNYSYKIIVDGVWQKDPTNPNFQYDKSGNYLSILKIPQKMIVYHKNPEKIGENEYKFSYKNNLAETVYLVGDFNNYNPYENKMERDDNGIWITKAQLFPGVHYFCFVVDGNWILDPNIIKTAYNRFDKKFTVIKVQ